MINPAPALPSQVPVTFTKRGTLWSNATADPVITPTVVGQNCTTDAANLTTFGESYNSTVIYNCTYANRTSIPSVLTFAATMSNNLSAHARPSLPTSSRARAGLCAGPECV